MKKKILAGILSLTFLLSGCGEISGKVVDTPHTVGENSIIEDVASNDSQGNIKTIKENISSIKDKFTKKDEEINIEELQMATNTFNWNLFNTLDLNSNQFYSPLSIEQAIGIALIGADGNTKEEIATALGIENVDLFFENSALLNSTKHTNYQIANGIWINSNYEKDLNENYNDLFITPAIENFNASVNVKPFTSDTKEEIRQFVEDNTNGFIPNYESEVEPSDVADIMNAIYFKADWETEFDANYTRTDTFHGRDTESEVDFMKMFDERFKYDETDELQVISIPYKEGNESMIILLPKDDTNIIDILKDKNPEEINEILENVSNQGKRKIRLLQLPKFEQELKIEGLEEKLMNLGMVSAFSNRANFSNLGNVYISKIFHKAKIRVDEKGTEAAATTEIIMTKGAAPSFEEKIDFIVDKPFVYIIRDENSGTILFTGLIQNL